MKTKIWLLAGYMLFSSCYSYRTMNTEIPKIVEGKKYKIVTTDDKKHKIRILKYGDTLVGRKSKSSRAFIKLTKEEVKVIKKRKFSLVKTIGLPITIVGAALGIFAISAGPDFDLSIDYLQN